MTDHPCAGLSSLAVAAFEQVVVGAVPQCGWASIDELLAAGVIVRGVDDRLVDAMGPYVRVHFYVPVEVRAQWHVWSCAQQNRGSDEKV